LLILINYFEILQLPIEPITFCNVMHQLLRHGW